MKTDVSIPAMSVTTACSKQYHGVGPDSLSFDCKITYRPRDCRDLQSPGEAPVSSSFQVTPAGISVSGNPESVGGYIQEVDVQRISPDPTAAQASVGEGYAHILYGDQDNKTPRFKQLLPLKPDVGHSLDKTYSHY
jgi:hypothetical protein